MATPYIGEVRLFAGTFAPVGWNLCDGSTLSIAEYSTLYTLIGTTYGGDGQSTFCVPDLRGRLPMHFGNNGTATHALGEKAGTETVTLGSTQMPVHNHVVVASNTTAASAAPANAVPATATAKSFSKSATPTLRPMASQFLAAQGGSLPHDNVQPSLVVTFIIALEGVYPSQ